MTADDVEDVLGRLESARIDVWLDGGWAVDAVLAEQTRAHEDLDIIVRLDDTPRLREVFSGAAFRSVEGGRESNLVVRDARSREVDVHAVRFDDRGNGIYLMENGDEWVFPAHGFEGRGVIRGRVVKCLTPDVQMLCHSTGYDPGWTDFHDMRLLNARLGTELVPPFDRLATDT